jgi:hypothetical protein
MEIELPANLWILTAASGDIPWPLTADAEKHRFINQCASEGLFPLLFAAPPHEVGNALRGWGALAAANNHRTHTLARRIESLPDLIGEEFAILKGTDYSYRLYPSPELRPQADIDVLVREKRIDDVCARIEQRGFRRRFTAASHRSRRWPDRTYDLGDVTLEVHHRIVQRSRAKIDYDAIWERRLPFRGATRLSDADALLVSVMNIAKDDLAVTLLRYLDIWLMLRGDTALFGVAAARAREWQMAAAFDAVMRVLMSMFPDLAIVRPRRPLLDRLLPLRYATVHRDRRRNVARHELWWRKFWLVDGVWRPIFFALDNLAMNAGGWRRARRADA